MVADDEQESEKNLIELDGDAISNKVGVGSRMYL